MVLKWMNLFQTIVRVMDVYRVEAGVKAKKPVCLHFTAKKSEEINCCPEEDGVKTCTLNYINQCLREVSGTRQLVNAKK